MFAAIIIIHEYERAILVHLFNRNFFVNVHWKKFSRFLFFFYHTLQSIIRLLLKSMLWPAKYCIRWMKRFSSTSISLMRTLPPPNHGYKIFFYKSFECSVIYVAVSGIFWSREVKLKGIFPFCESVPKFSIWLLWISSSFRV